MLVSVIIVSWNAKAYLRKCLDSLRNQKKIPLEIIVVDNASTDGSPEAVEADYPEVRLIQNTKNVGFSRANNIGIRVSRGDYLAFVNSDVEVLIGCIATLVEFCEATPKVGMVGPRIAGGDGRLQRSCRGFPTVWNQFCRALALDTVFRTEIFSGYAMTYWGHNTCRKVDILQGSFMLVKREALEGVGGWDESFFVYGEDMDFCRRFWAAGWEVMFVPEARAIHYGGSSSANAPVRFYIEKARADMQYWLKHESPIAAESYFFISVLHEMVRIAGYAFPALFKPKARYKLKRSAACLRWMLVDRTPVKNV